MTTVLESHYYFLGRGRFNPAFYFLKGKGHTTVGWEATTPGAGDATAIWIRRIVSPAAKKTHQI